MDKQKIPAVVDYEAPNGKSYQVDCGHGIRVDDVRILTAHFACCAVHGLRHGEGLPHVGKIDICAVFHPKPLIRREGDKLFFEVTMPLAGYVEQPELTLHMERLATYEEENGAAVTIGNGERTGSYRPPSGFAQ